MVSKPERFLMDNKESGKKGGDKTAAIHKDDEFYSQQGEKGGGKVLEKYGKDFYREIGLKGALARKKKMEEKKKGGG
jgi:hypothetical protein